MIIKNNIVYLSLDIIVIIKDKDMKSKRIIAIAAMGISLIISASSCKCSAASQRSENTVEAVSDNGQEASAKTVKLTQDEFRNLVFDYKLPEGERKFLGKKPVVIDFWATWCGPCLRMGPILEELAAEYGDKLIIYKVDVDSAHELAQALGIRSIPAFFFIDAEGNITTSVGLTPKNSFKNEIETRLFSK